MFYPNSQDKEKLVKTLRSQEITCKLTVLNGTSGEDPQILGGPYGVAGGGGGYGVMVSMFDFHRSDRGSNPSRGGKIS